MRRPQKNFIIYTFSAFLLFLFFFVNNILLYSLNERKKSQLNLLLVTIDTLRPDWLSCYSSEHLNTPNIDRLAMKGALFLNAFANTPTTLPSHANILLGVTPLYHGVHDNLNFVIREELFTIAEHLKNHNYSNGAFIGAFPLDAKFGLNQGFDIYDDEIERESLQDFLSEERKCEVVVDRALDWLNKQIAPWFLWIHCWDPHDPYEPPEPFQTEYKKHPYTGEVAYVDSALGRLFAYLEENNLFEETLIVLTGDHGESLGQHGEDTHGFFAYNTTIWVPLIIVSPGMGKRQVEQYVNHVDVFPTVCDILNLEKPPFLQGVSLAPALEGKKLSERPIYFESLHPYYSHGWAPLRGFIFNKEKYIHSPIPELYDLGVDFDEKNNLSEKRKLDKYERQLEKIMSELTSPESKKAEERLDRESLEKLKSLGYAASSQYARKESFVRNDDVKTLLPFYNRAMEALEWYEEGRKKEGIEALKLIITERKDFAVAYINLADLYKKEKRLKDAIGILKNGHENVPYDYFVFFSLINYLLEDGQYKNIIEAIDGKNYLQMEYDPAIWNLLGHAYYKTKNFEKAIDQYEHAISLDDESPIFFTNLGEAQYSLALENKDRAILEKALRSFQRAVELDADYSLAYLGLGKVYRLGGNSAGAIAALKKALKIDSKLNEALLILGLSYFENSDKMIALSIFTLYKQKYYDSLPWEFRQQLDDLIKRCEDEIP